MLLLLTLGHFLHVLKKQASDSTSACDPTRLALEKNQKGDFSSSVSDRSKALPAVEVVRYDTVFVVDEIILDNYLVP